MSDSQQKLAGIFRESAVPLAVSELGTGRFIEINDAFMRVMHADTSTQILGHASTEIGIITPQDRAKLAEQVKASSRAHRFITELHRLDGEAFVAELFMNSYEHEGERYLLTGVVDITERRKAEEAVHHSHSLLSAALESTADGILIVNSSGQVTGFNRRFLELWRIPEVLAESRDDTSLLQFVVNQLQAPDVFLTKVQELYDDAEASFRDELHFLDGRVFERYSQPQRLGGVVVGRVWSFRDVTERKQAEEALAKEKRLFDYLTANIPDTIYFKDRQSRFIRMNDAMAKLFRLSSPAEAVGKTDFDFHELAHAQQTYDDEQRIMANGETIIGKEERIQRSNGQLNWVSTTKVPVRDEQGTITGLVGISRDITERKHAEAERLRLAAAIEQSAESVLITDTQGGIVYANPAFERTTGYKLAEVLGKNPNILKSGEHDPAFYQKMWNTVKSGGIWHGQIVNKRKDGTLFQEEVTISPIRDANGTIVNYMASKLDITRQIDLEDQLRQSQKLEAIGRLAGGVAHDFNNILVSIILQAQLSLADGQMSGEVREGLRHIAADAERAANLTRQLLLFSRKQVMQARNMDLNDVVTSLAKMLQRLISENVRLQIHLYSAPLIVYADSGMLDQVLLNLAVNARDAMPQGGNLIIRTMEKQVDEGSATSDPDIGPGHYVGFSVTDTGTGIPPEIRPKIFEPFFTTKEPGKGTGLGLATVFGIVKQHHGFIEVESEAGSGTEFRVFLPSSQVDSKNLAVAARPEPRGGIETILLAEDDTNVRLITHKVLTNSGYHVLECANGSEALEVWQKHLGAVALLLTDLVMPDGVNGQYLADRLRQDKPRLKVVFMSGYSTEITGRQIELKPGENLLQKPFSRDQLLETVRLCLNG